LPSIGGAVMFVNGVHRGEHGVLQAIGTFLCFDLTTNAYDNICCVKKHFFCCFFVFADVKKFCATVKLTTSVHRGEVVSNVDYEHVSKLKLDEQ
jgi:hypothetical protein